MTIVNWSGAARADLDLQYQFLLEIDPEIATRSVRAIVESGGSLARSPKRGTPIADTPGLRKLFVSFGKHGYIIHYVILEEEVLSLRVYHGRQNRPS